MIRRRTLLVGGFASAAVLASGLTMRSGFRSDIEGHLKRIGSGSSMLASRFGAMEYAVTGEGPPVFMIHGTGGGFDQGMAMAGPLINAGFKVVAPSRFGYLRTAFPDDASSQAQADAIIELMDFLRISRAAVIGVSAGALTALQCAIRHPERLSALVALVPATYVPGREPVRPNLLGATIMRYALQSDFLFWAGIKIAEDTMISTILATAPALVHQADPAERERALSVLHDILPISARTKGLLNDGKLAGTPEQMDLKAIKTPTLAISTEDDAYGTYPAAKHIAASVEGAKFVGYPAGGHAFVGRGPDVYAEIAAFLSAHMPS